MYNTSPTTPFSVWQNLSLSLALYNRDVLPHNYYVIRCKLYVHIFLLDLHQRCRKTAFHSIYEIPLHIWEIGDSTPCMGDRDSTPYMGDRDSTPYMGDRGLYHQ